MVPSVSEPQPGSGCPRLVGIAGPLTGDVLPLGPNDVTIGRDVTNTICLSDLSLSRCHCAIAPGNGAWVLRDLKSSNGTFVNGMQVTEQQLHHGDRLTLGESVFLFVAKAAEHDVPVRLHGGGENTPTARLDIFDTTYLQPHPVPGAPRSARVERGLRALVKISTTVNSIKEEDELYRQLLDLIATIIPAEQLAIIVLGQDGEARTAHTQAVGGSAPLHINGTVIRQAIEQHAAVLHRDAPTNLGLAAADSVASASSHSIMCVPMVIRDRVLGALYFTTTARAAFDDDDLQLVAAIASVAAIAIDNVRHAAWLQNEAERLQRDSQLEHSIVGNSAAMRRIYDIVARVSRSAATSVLILGETGTGKELVARAIHVNSERAKRLFVAINCAALTETLLETELFGHERGAFTGAVAQKKGKLEIADGGTVFLDEVGELAPALQTKLLRVLQEREFERVGAVRPTRVDIRVIAATNRNLAEEVAARRFREDLYHRLNVVRVNVPPLRERREDIPQLARHFLAKFGRKSARPLRCIAPAAMRHLLTYPWPGNVRELENAIERAVVLGSSEEVLLDDLPETLIEGVSARDSDLPRFHDALRRTKQRIIVDAFYQAKGSYLETARLLGLHPNYLHRLIRNLELKPALEAQEV